MATHPHEHHPTKKTKKRLKDLRKDDPLYHPYNEFMALFMKRNAAPRDGTAVQKKGNLYWHKVIAQDEAKF
jgi:hypothetical protein